MAPCRRVRYTTRRVARGALKEMRGRGLDVRGMRAYMHTCGFWHVGHLAPEIVRGEASREEKYGAR